VIRGGPTEQKRGGPNGKKPPRRTPFYTIYDPRTGTEISEVNFDKLNGRYGITTSSYPKPWSWLEDNSLIYAAPDADKKRWTIERYSPDGALAWQKDFAMEETRDVLQEIVAERNELMLNGKTSDQWRVLKLNAKDGSTMWEYSVEAGDEKIIHETRTTKNGDVIVVTLNRDSNDRDTALVEVHLTKLSSAEGKKVWVTSYPKKLLHGTFNWERKGEWLYLDTKGDLTIVAGKSETEWLIARLSGKTGVLTWEVPMQGPVLQGKPPGKNPWDKDFRTTVDPAGNVWHSIQSTISKTKPFGHLGVYGAASGKLLWDSDSVSGK
jgi:hypothetical protein